METRHSKNINEENKIKLKERRINYIDLELESEGGSEPESATSDDEYESDESKYFLILTFIP